VEPDGRQEGLPHRLIPDQQVDAEEPVDPLVSRWSAGWPSTVRDAQVTSGSQGHTNRSIHDPGAVPASRGALDE
jgi:hypothetical protein